MSTTDLQPPPYTAPIIGANGKMSLLWANFFKQLYARAGGASAVSNDQIVIPPWNTSQIAAQAITGALLGAVAGSGLAGGNGSTLTVAVDGVTIDAAGSGGSIEVKPGGIGSTQLAAASVGTSQLVGSIPFSKLLSTDWSASLGTSGYQKLGSSLYVQWGTTGSISSNAASSVSFATSFPSGCYQVTACISGDPGSISGHFGAGSLSASAFTLYNRTSANLAFTYWAVGQ